jgi:hypothetical protein
MSRAALADFVGRTERWLYDVETGRATPSLADISKMAFALRYPEPVVAGWAPVSEDQDVNRRHFLKLGAVAATAAAFHDKLDGRLPDPSSPDLSYAVDQFTSKFRGLDNQHGGGFGKAVATDYLDGRIMPLVRQGTYSDGVGQQLWKSTARLAHLVAWMEFDTEGHAAADNFLSTALKLATAANDTAFAAEILAGSSHHALHLGNHTLAIESARAAQRIARDSDVPALMAEAYIAEAHGLALRGDGPAAAAALHNADQQMDRPTAANPLPDWLSYFDEGYMAARVAHVLRDLGDWQGSTRFAEHALRMNPGLNRAQAFNTLILADAHLGDGEVDQACQLGSMNRPGFRGD